MGSRGGKSNTTLADLGCSKETISNLTITVQQREAALSKAQLLKTYDRLNAVLGRDKEKDCAKGRKAAERDTLSDLAFKVCGLADMVSGMLLAVEHKQSQSLQLMNTALEPGRIRMAAKETEKAKALQTLEPAYDVFQAAVESVYRIKLQDVIIGSLERQLKEQG